MDEVAGRIAAIAGISAALDSGGSPDTTIAAVADDGTALDLLVGGGEAKGKSVAAAAKKLGPWNALMLRPIRSVNAADGETAGAETRGAETRGAPLVQPGDSVAEAARRILQRHLEQFMARTYGLACREDVEYVHEMRVALRRFRAAMRVFGAAVEGLPPELKGEVRFFAQELGGVRDLDVFMDFLDGYAGRAPRAHKPFLRGLVQSVRRRRSGRYRALVATFGSGRYEEFKDRYHALLKASVESGDGLRPRGKKGQRGMRAAAPRMLRRRLRKVLKYDRRPDRYPPQKLHALRIECKKLRYTAEFLADIYPGGLHEIIGPMTQMQDALGEVHDADLYAERVGRYLKRSRRGREAGAQRAERALLGHLQEVRGQSLARAAGVLQGFRRRKALTGLEKLMRTPRQK